MNFFYPSLISFCLFLSYSLILFHFFISNIPLNLLTNMILTSEDLFVKNASNITNKVSTEGLRIISLVWFDFGPKPKSMGSQFSELNTNYS